MPPAPHPPLTGKKTRRTTTLTRLAHHRRTALTHILRGACYGMGTGIIGLAFMWLDQHLL